MKNWVRNIHSQPKAPLWTYFETYFTTIPFYWTCEIWIFRYSFNLYRIQQSLNLIKASWQMPKIVHYIPMLWPRKIYIGSVTSQSFYWYKLHQLAWNDGMATNICSTNQRLYLVRPLSVYECKQSLTTCLLRFCQPIRS